jgi:hypothetical protein
VSRLSSGDSVSVSSISENSISEHLGNIEICLGEATPTRLMVPLSRSSLKDGGNYTLPSHSVYALHDRDYPGNPSTPFAEGVAYH